MLAYYIATFLLLTIPATIVGITALAGARRNPVTPQAFGLFMARPRASYNFLTA